jgi:hypothetical protein
MTWCCGWPGPQTFPPRTGNCHDEPMSDVQSPTLAFRAARDLLLRHRADYAAAMAGFRWPVEDPASLAFLADGSVDGCHRGMTVAGAPDSHHRPGLSPAGRGA